MLLLPLAVIFSAAALTESAIVGNSGSAVYDHTDFRALTYQTVDCPDEDGCYLYASISDGDTAYTDRITIHNGTVRSITLSQLAKDQLNANTGEKNPYVLHKGKTSIDNQNTVDPTQPFLIYFVVLAYNWRPKPIPPVFEAGLVPSITALDNTQLMTVKQQMTVTNFARDKDAHVYVRTGAVAIPGELISIVSYEAAGLIVAPTQLLHINTNSTKVTLDIDTTPKNDFTFNPSSAIAVTSSGYFEYSSQLHSSLSKTQTYIFRSSGPSRNSYCQLDFSGKAQDSIVLQYSNNNGPTYSFTGRQAANFLDEFQATFLNVTFNLSNDPNSYGYVQFTMFGSASQGNIFFTICTIVAAFLLQH